MKMAVVSDIISKTITGEWGQETLSNEGVNVLRTTNFTNEGRLNLTEVVKRNISKAKIEAKRLIFGDTIIEKSGGSPNQPVGRVVYFNITEGIYLTNNFTAILRISSDYDKRYFFYFMFRNHLNKTTLKYQNKTTGIINLQLKRYLDSTKIPLPPLEEQKRIAAILDKADEIRQKRRQSLKLADEYLRSVFLDMFGDPVTNPKGWERPTLEDLTTEIVDCPHSTPNHTTITTEYPCIRTSEIHNGQINWNSMKYTDEKEYKERTKRLIPMEGDVVYAREGTFGDAIRIPKNSKISLGQRTMLFRANEEICNPIFFWAVLRSNWVFHQALRKTSGSTVGHINVKDAKQFQGILPSLSLQNKFAEIVNKTEEIKSKMQTQLDEAENLFASLMQRAFRGEL